MVMMSIATTISNNEKPPSGDRFVWPFDWERLFRVLANIVVPPDLDPA
jgi:hypothetical protein